MKRLLILAITAVVLIIIFGIALYFKTPAAPAIPEAKTVDDSFLKKLNLGYGDLLEFEGFQGGPHLGFITNIGYDDVMVCFSPGERSVPYHDIILTVLAKKGKLKKMVYRTTDASYPNKLQEWSKQLY